MKKLLLFAAALILMVTAASAQEIKISAKLVKDTLIADVLAEDNPGIAGFSINMNFDKTKLTPVTLETGDALKGYSVTSNIHIEDNLEKLSHVSAVWINTSNQKNNGVLYTVVFDVKDCAEGTTELTLEYEEGNISNSSLESVDFDLTGAVIDFDDEKITAGSTSPGGTIVVRPPASEEEPEAELFQPFKVYADVAEIDWYFADVAYVYQKGIMTGTANEPELLFSPLLNTNRAMFVTVLYRMEGEPQARSSTFDDIEAGSYYEKAVAWACENNIVNGISPTEFAPLSSITREQTAKIIANYAAYKGIAIPEKNTDITKFSDYSKVSEWALEALQICVDMDIIRGRNDNTLDPQGSTTRAETAAILRRLVEYIQANK